MILLYRFDDLTIKEKSSGQQFLNNDDERFTQNSLTGDKSWVYGYDIEAKVE